MGIIAANVAEARKKLVEALAAKTSPERAEALVKDLESKSSSLIPVVLSWVTEEGLGAIMRFRDAILQRDPDAAAALLASTLDAQDLIARRDKILDDMALEVAKSVQFAALRQKLIYTVIPAVGSILLAFL